MQPKLVLFFVFLFCCSWAKTQNFAEEHFYYYKGDSIVLDVDYARILIISENEYITGSELS
jgi:hypothetical protein